MKEILNDLKVLFSDIYYYLTRPVIRLVYGYDKRDLWGLDEYVARRILPALKAFEKNKKYGYPSHLSNLKEWKHIIKEMIYGLEHLEDFDRGQRGRELFGKYLTHLWD